ncbi:MULTISPECIES: IclR family transcriptional regulator [Burkholderiales]|jgi:DNA-binding IclR family transcriptional regulator|uniref:p-hydroxybenzoate hydroxylase transcriptional activator n=2 Tax=Burkholderiales TaxID=80840 RepID=A0AAD2J6K5_ACHAE|nr:MULTISPECIES: IclR family transcriptional regulator [Achromobacter]MCA0324630.1 IclR family transcriptional regulator [Pseudomonadota bacterium]CAB3922116.1 HTH-type transcriptional regulator TsaQ1/TsaQ2 [Achromobacter mucicolens]CUJ79178.1 p-hydroxybenzoate hydroxylase transcriptional activator [Achromobacter aegrifaciens]
MPKPEIQPPTTKTVRDESEHGEWFATTLARGLSLIEAFGPEDTWLGNAELSRRTGLSKPTVSRLSSTLIELGFLTRNDEGKFRPGVRLLALAYPVLRSLTIRLVARPLMLEVAREIRGAVSLGALDRLSLIYVETARSTDPHPRSPDVGNNAPLIQTAIGRALLAQLDEATRMRVLEQTRTDMPDLWERHHAKAAEAVQDCARQGYCLSYGDFDPRVHAVGVPLLTLPDGTALAMNCGIPAFRLGYGQLENDVAPRAVALAASIRTMWKP